MINSQIKFSIIIIGYNSEKTIEKCINSCICQTYKNIEIIFVDDGSTDKTHDKVLSMAKRDSRIRYIYQSNSGSNKARIHGYLEARGEYISFLDSDDYIHHNMVQYLVQKFDENSNLDIIVYDNLRFNNEGDIFDDKHNYQEGLYSNKSFLELILTREIPQYLVTRGYTKDFLKEVGFEKIPPITMGDDFAASVMMAIRNPVVLIIPQKLYYYRKNPDSISSRPNKKYRDLVKMMNYVCDFLKECNMLEYYKDLIDFNYFILFCNYVVENKYKHTDIQQEIYLEWKERKIKLTKNIYIKEYLSKKSVFRVCLIYLTNHCFFLGRLISRFYGIVTENYKCQRTLISL